MPHPAARPLAPVAAWRHLLVVGWVLGLVVLGTRGLITEDSRYGFGMFSHKVIYTIQYAWVLADGERVKQTPSKELRGKAKGFLRSDKWHSSYYATGSMKAQVKGYAQYMVTHHPWDGAVAFEAVVRHRKYDEKNLTETIISVPVESGP
jgi:hypothetical protein